MSPMLSHGWLSHGNRRELNEILVTNGDRDKSNEIGWRIAKFSSSLQERAEEMRSAVILEGES